MDTTPHKRKRSRVRILSNLLSLLFSVALLFLFFLALFHYRPPFEVAALATAAFVVVLLSLIQKLEPVIGSLALQIHPDFPTTARQNNGLPEEAPGDAETRKDLEELEKELLSFASRTDLSRLEMLEYMEKQIQRQKLAAEKLKEAGEEKSSPEGSEEQADADDNR
jgi:hypothetical protein